ncbi:BppU family phage baseplate upper protein [Bacillus thuringiensis]|uniref:BppU family phage baseplate upper protein n=1 Tax=Bacillus thuringiensis TaxID=1428 RepID=UPI00210062B7|nr:BppU family phage baseplate upper protein [Bacillus thuringiensis]
MQYKDFATKEEELKVMRFYQNDLNSAKLLINVTHDKVVTDFSTATKVQIAFLKPDGKRVFQDVQNVNQMQGKYYVVLSTQTLIAYGNVVAQLRLTFPNNKVIETCKFVFAVDESIMSDTALESTNEFPVIQKAIEVGEKFKDVDFAPIIAAGELAKGALPKTGGVMTGNIVMDRKVANSTIYSQFITSGVGSGGTSHYFVGMNAAGKYHLYDDVAKITPFEYDPVAKSFNVLSATNLVKKAGDTMTGSLELMNELRFGGAASVQQALFKGDGSTTKSVWLAKAQEGIVIVTETAPGTGTRDWANAVYVGGSQNNVVKKAGDTMTGTLTMSGVTAQIRVDDKGPSIRIDQPNDTTTTSARGLALHENNVMMGGFGRIRNGTTVDQMYMGWGANPWSENTSLTVSDSKFLYKNKPVAMRDKDGRVNLTLTSDANNFDTSRPPVVDRRGNTVTIRAAIGLNASATANLVTTLPADMRPLGNITHTVLTNDGAATTLEIYTNGTVTLANSAKGKNVYILTTYVVD